jgi:hypothetical protein
MRWRVEKTEDGGVYLSGEGDARVRGYQVSTNCDRVELWILLTDGGIDELVSYFTPAEAMALGNALRRCATGALEYDG